MLLLLHVLQCVLLVAASICVKGDFVLQGTRLVGTGSIGFPAQGYSVAVSANGDIAAIGAWSDDNQIGATWVFARSGLPWAQFGAKLVGTGRSGASQQGIGVGISGDGNTIIVGGNRDASSAGAAWIFVKGASSFVQQGPKLVGSGSTISQPSQGTSVSLSYDGNTALIGGYWDGGAIGACWVFVRSGTTWTQQGTKLVGSGGVSFGYQGWSSSLSADGNTALIGGYYDNSQVGAAWIFVRSGTTWSQQGSKLTANDRIGSSMFGRSVSLSSDGETALIGGYGDNGGAGAFWIFTRSGSTWTQDGSKRIPSPSGVSFGVSVAINFNGTTAIVGGDNGAVWAFTKSAASLWNQHGGKLVGTAGSGLTSVAVSADGLRAVVGVPLEFNHVGSTYMFAYETPTSAPSRTPSLSPSTSRPTSTPSAVPTGSPSSSRPSFSPSSSKPTQSPSERPTTSRPSFSPTMSPSTSTPSRLPTGNPTTTSPSLQPTVSPSTSTPSVSPATSRPSKSPTSSAPSKSPTATPITGAPTTPFSSSTVNNRCSVLWMMSTLLFSFIFVL